MTDYEIYQLLEENGYEPSEENLAIVKNLDEDAEYEYSDYELYQLLEDNGYEPSEENLAYLRENMDLLDEGILTWNATRHGDNMEKYSNELNRINDIKNDSARFNALSSRRKAKLERRAEKAAKKVQKANDYMQDKMAAGATNKLKAFSDAAKTRKAENNKNDKMMNKLNTDYGEAVKKSREQYHNVTGLGTATDEVHSGAVSTAQHNKAVAANKNIKKNPKGFFANVKNKFQKIFTGRQSLNESVEILADLLESNGYEVSEENIITLSENLVNDTCAVLDSTDVILTEGMDSDYVYMQLLDNNGFEVTENNIAVLKEAMDNGHILLV